MGAGLNVKVTFWHQSNDTDDSIGGANITGTALATNVPARITPIMPTLQYLEQGIEVEKLFRVRAVPGTLSGVEFDRIEVTWPTDHQFYGQMLLVRGFVHDSLYKGQSRAHLEMICSRVKTSRA